MCYFSVKSVQKVYWEIYFALLFIFVFNYLVFVDVHFKWHISIWTDYI